MGRLQDNRYPGWDTLDKAAAVYRRVTDQYGGKISIYNDAETGEQILRDTRTLLQVELANYIVGGAYDYICGLADAVFRGPGVNLTVGFSNEVRIRLGTFRNIFDVEDMASVGCYGVMRHLGKYDPERSSIAYFIRQRSVAEMHRHAWDYGKGVIHAPENNLQKCMQIVLDSSDHAEAIEEIVKNFGLLPEHAAIIYHAVTGDFQDMHEIYEHHGIHPNLDDDTNKGHTFEQLNLRGHPAFDPYSALLNSEISQRLDEMISRLKEKSREVLVRNYGITYEELEHEPESLEQIGNSMGETRFAVFETKNRAIQRMRAMKQAVNALRELAA